jgi:hypothetical protein
MGKSAKISQNALLSENAKAGLSNLRVDTEGKIDVILENILGLSQNAMMESEVNGFFDAKSY